jgi:hypothetical protein
MTASPRGTCAAYVYDGWHACPERDAHFRPGWTEWELLKDARPIFEGHVPPPLPEGGPYDDSLPQTWDRRIATARAFGVDVFVCGWFWSRGKKVFEAALDSGYLRSERRDDIRFAVFWANRMPHRVLPLRAADPEAPPEYRKVYSDPDDVVALIEDCAERFFARPSYWRIDGRPYFAIFDTTLFLRQLGPERARRALSRAKDRTGGLYVVAIDPDVPWRPHLRDIGFDAVSHYVLLPQWKGGPRLQDYEACARRREGEWASFEEACGLPYHPSAAVGWDATPRGVFHPHEPPDRFPWAPIVTDATPERFARHAAAAERFAVERRGGGAPFFIASWNEWTEGHALEPCARVGDARLRALKAARKWRTIA